MVTVIAAGDHRSRGAQGLRYAREGGARRPGRRRLSVSPLDGRGSPAKSREWRTGRGRRGPVRGRRAGRGGRAGPGREGRRVKRFCVRELPRSGKAGELLERIRHQRGRDRQRRQGTPRGDEAGGTSEARSGCGMGGEKELDLSGRLGGPSSPLFAHPCCPVKTFTETGGPVLRGRRLTQGPGRPTSMTAIRSGSGGLESGKEKRRVGLVGVDSPELNDPQEPSRLVAFLARRFVSWKLNQAARPPDPGQGGGGGGCLRAFAGLRLDERCGRCSMRTLVREGYARAYLKYPLRNEAVKARLREAESEARRAGRGLWREEAPL